MKNLPYENFCSQQVVPISGAKKFVFYLFQKQYKLWNKIVFNIQMTM